MGKWVRAVLGHSKRRDLHLNAFESICYGNSEGVG